MMNNNKEDATLVASNETGTGNSNGEKTLSNGDKSESRSFGVTELWSIRRSARVFKIHSRIPRL
jgi:hypothetical protein